MVGKSLDFYLIVFYLFLYQASSFTPEQAERFREVFRKFDTNNNGVIDAGELKEGLKELGKIFSDEDVTEIMKEADLDQNGVIDEEEFAKYAGQVFSKRAAKENDNIKVLFEVRCSAE